MFTFTVLNFLHIIGFILIMALILYISGNKIKVIKRDYPPLKIKKDDSDETLDN